MWAQDNEERLKKGMQGLLQLLRKLPTEDILVNGEKRKVTKITTDAESQITGTMVNSEGDMWCPATSFFDSFTLPRKVTINRIWDARNKTVYIDVTRTLVGIQTRQDYLQGSSLRNWLADNTAITSQTWELRNIFQRYDDGPRGGSQVKKIQRRIDLADVPQFEALLQVGGLRP